MRYEIFWSAEQALRKFVSDITYLTWQSSLPSLLNVSVKVIPLTRYIHGLCFETLSPPVKQYFELCEVFPTTQSHWITKHNPYIQVGTFDNSIFIPVRQHRDIEWHKVEPGDAAWTTCLLLLTPSLNRCFGPRDMDIEVVQPACCIQ
jgi:hypothetical protein